MKSASSVLQKEGFSHSQTLLSLMIYEMNVYKWVHGQYEQLLSNNQLHTGIKAWRAESLRQVTILSPYTRILQE